MAAFGATTAILLPTFLARRAATPRAQQQALRDRWVRRWCRTLLSVFGVHFRVYGAIQTAPGGRLVVANHRSTADILALLATFGGEMVSRADVADWPLIGAAARAVGTVFVDRSSAFSGASAVRTIRARLQSGATVVVFPEGGTSVGDEVRAFRGGAFVAALRAHAQIIPVGLAYSRDSQAAFVGESFPAHLARVAAAPPSSLVMCIGSPISAQAAATPAVLRDQVHAGVVALVTRARILVDG